MLYIFKYKCKKILLIVSQKLYKLLLYLLPLKKGTNYIRRDVPIVISLTSYPVRFSYLPFCLKSLLYQTVKPDKIILWLGSDTKERQIPPKLKVFEKFGVEIILLKENLKSHKKYFYAMQKYPNDIIITVDDDVIYSPFLVSSLLKTHKLYPAVVCARRVHKIKIDNDRLLPYRYWETSYEKETEPSKLLMGIGVGGILYPSNCLYKDSFDIQKIQELCFDADDIWLKFMEILNGSPVVWCKCLWIHPIKINENDTTGLERSNVENNGNDLFIQKMLNAYPQFISDIKERI